MRAKLVWKALSVGTVLTLGACSLAVDLSELEAGCGSGRKQCEGVCIPSDDPETGCARSGCQPCALPHATPICDNDGSCAIAACIGSYENCDEKRDNGCEIDLDTSLEHCGACDARPCVVENAEPACGSGSCAIRRCLPGFRDCDRMARDGCEIDTTTSFDHCGACDAPCAVGEACVNGVCT